MRGYVIAHDETYKHYRVRIFRHSRGFYYWHIVDGCRGIVYSATVPWSSPDWAAWDAKLHIDGQDLDGPTYIRRRGLPGQGKTA